MRMFLAPLLLLSSLLLFQPGCATLAKGETLMRHEPGEQTLVLKADKDGEYALLKGNDITPKFKVPLRRGDNIGFKSAPDGKISAVWGNDERPIDDGRYYWKYVGK